MVSGSITWRVISHEQLALFGLEMLDQVGDVGRVQILDQRLDLRDVALRQGGRDILQQLLGGAVELFLVDRLDRRADRRSCSAAGLAVSGRPCGLRSWASTTATAVMLTMPRTVTAGERICAGLRGAEQDRADRLPLAQMAQQVERDVGGVERSA